MGFSGHFLARIQVEELVHLRSCQSVSDLQVLHDKHLPGDWLIHCRPRSHLSLWVHLVLKSHLGGEVKEKLGNGEEMTQGMYVICMRAP